MVNEYDELIEFGAIKIKNGSEVDRIDLFVKPVKGVPQHITNLTKITNEMVEDAPHIKPSLVQIKAWIGDAILIAHNGINFDLRFLNKKLEQHHLPLITNPLIDTMQLSRALNKDLVKHNLGVIARHHKIYYDEAVAHRADFDAAVLNDV
ncbi:DNA polymerase III polC-type [Bacteroidales bacterium Barb4]|nr:DNA polymerase III polC-type [Bacteroidales bacterium Barb4]